MKNVIKVIKPAKNRHQNTGRIFWIYSAMQVAKGSIGNFYPQYEKKSPAPISLTSNFKEIYYDTLPHCKLRQFWKDLIGAGLSWLVNILCCADLGGALDHTSQTQPHHANLHCTTPNIHHPGSPCTNKISLNLPYFAICFLEEYSTAGVWQHDQLHVTWCTYIGNLTVKHRRLSSPMSATAYLCILQQLQNN